MSRRTRRATRLATCLVVFALGVLVVDGCGLQTPGGVRIDQRTVNTAEDVPDIRKLPPGPVPGASPSALVNGFMEAAAADPDYTTAQEFLADTVVWNDRDAATVYDPASVSTSTVSVTRGLAKVRMTMQALASVSSDGVFLPLSRRLDVTYQLRKLGGQWRLTDVPSGVLLTPRDLARSYRPIRTYDFNPARSVLVAEPGYVTADRAGLAGAAVHALLTGWGGALASTDVDAGGLIPGLTTLGSVVVQSGEATVDLGREAFRVPQDRRPLLVSQIAATLVSVPGVFSVRVTVEERPYVGGSVPVEIASSLAAMSTGAALAIGPAGGLVSLVGGRPVPVRWAGRDQQLLATLLDPVSAPGGARFALLRQGAQGSDLVIAGLAGINRPVATQRAVIPLGLPAASYQPPQWLDSDRLLLPTAGPQPVLQLVDVSRSRPTVHPVASPGLAALGPLSACAVSRDGTRAVVLAGPTGARRLYLGRISAVPGRSADDGLSVGGWTAVPTGLADISDVTWSADLAVTVVGHPSLAGSAMRTEVVGLDTVSDPTLLPTLPAAVAAASPADAVDVAAAPGRPTVLGLAGQSWILQNGRWTPAPASTDLSYP